MSENHRIPAIDRMIELLSLLERHQGGLSIPEFVSASGVPRSTVYRILNSLEGHGVVQRQSNGRYVLGSRLLGFAPGIRGAPARQDLTALARPYLRRMSARTQEVSKLTLLNADRALCVEAVPGSSNVSLAPLVGRLFPIHAGAAGKILLAAMDEARQEEIIARGLDSFTPRTITDATLLRSELKRVRRNGWAEDRGEFSMSVRALAAPVIDGSNRVVGAVSVAYLAELHTLRGDNFRQAAIETAAAISEELVS